jgi:tRNA-2-methylthio-N6-dimethylallyladenosine synthase
LLNTCSIRENAEQRVFTRLENFKHLRTRGRKPVVGILGCMAERLKTKLLEHKNLVDLVAGPDSYRDLPHLLNMAEEGNAAVNVMLSADETYADIAPVRTLSNQVSAFV